MIYGLPKRFEPIIDIEYEGEPILIDAIIKVYEKKVNKNEL